MFSKFRKCVIVAASFTAMAFGAENASAGYVCQVTAPLWGGGLGTDGFVFFSIYTGANCTGTLERSAYLCSAGATNSLCPSSTGNHHARDSLILHFESLVRAADAAQRITLINAFCNGGGTTCTRGVSFLSN